MSARLSIVDVHLITQWRLLPEVLKSWECERAIIRSGRHTCLRLPAHECGIDGLPERPLALHKRSAQKWERAAKHSVLDIMRRMRVLLD